MRFIVFGASGLLYIAGYLWNWVRWLIADRAAGRDVYGLCNDGEGDALGIDTQLVPPALVCPTPDGDGIVTYGGDTVLFGLATGLLVLALAITAQRWFREHRILA